MNTNEDFSLFSEEIIHLAKNPEHFGRLNDPTVASYIKGECGDEMEFYLVIEDNIITDVRFYTDGCTSSVACGETAAKLIINKKINDALNLSPSMILRELEGFPEQYIHCSVLACLTVYKAFGEYLLLD